MAEKFWIHQQEANSKLPFTAVVQHELDAFMKYADVNGDGKIQYKEWYVFYTTVSDVINTNTFRSRNRHEFYVGLPFHVSLD